MLILPESIQTLINGLLAIFVRKEDLKQSDWNQTDTTKIDYIKNKPSIVSEDEFLSWLNEAKVVEPMASASGELYVNNNNEIYVL